VSSKKSGFFAIIRRWISQQCDLVRSCRETSTENTHCCFSPSPSGLNSVHCLRVFVLNAFNVGHPAEAELEDKATNG
jgi:hypothetical protein